VIAKRCLTDFKTLLHTPPIELTLNRLSGDTLEVEMMVVPTNSRAEGSILIVFHDISQRKWVEEEIRRRNIELAALNSISATISRTLDLDQILADTLDGVLGLGMMGGRAQGVIFLKNPDGNGLSLAAQRSAHKDHPCLATAPKLGECLCGLAVLTGERILCEDGHLDERHTRSWVSMPAHKDICLPLIVREAILGAMNIRLPADAVITQTVVDLLSAVADQGGCGRDQGGLERRDD